MANYQRNTPSRQKNVTYEIGRYNESNSILLTPDIKFEAAAGLYSPVVEAVTISTNPDDKEVYISNGKLRLHSKALERIGVAANVVWDVANCGPIHLIPGKECTYRACGGIQKADGKIEMISQYFEYNMQVVRDDLEKQYENDKAKDWKIDRDFRQKRKFMVPYCESMARARVIRKLLNIKQEYTTEELQKPFVMVRFQLNIDYSDPQIKLLAAKAHIMASAGLFGQAKQLDAPAPPVLLHHEKQIIDGHQADAEDVAQDRRPPMPEPPQAGQPMTMAFFNGLQRDDQISEIEKLIKRKGYDTSRLAMPVSQFPDNHIVGFFKTLVSMPDMSANPY